MARMVVLYFEDNNIAQEFVDAAVDHVVVGSYSNDVEDYTSTYGVKVIGLYAIPTKFCDCEENYKRTGKGLTGYLVARGEKFGWRIHAACHYALRGYQVAKNLIPEEKRSRIMYSNVMSISMYKDNKYQPEPHVNSIGQGDPAHD
jgi:hypothetical protein